MQKKKLKEEKIQIERDATRSSLAQLGESDQSRV